MEHFPEEGSFDMPDLLARRVVQVDADDEEAARCTAEATVDGVDGVVAAGDTPRSVADGIEVAVASAKEEVGEEELAKGRVCCPHER